LTNEPVVDTAALLWSPKKAPAPIEASPVSALFDPCAVLSSMKGSLPVQVQLRGSGRAGDLTARELDRAVADQSNVPLRTSAVPNPALPAVTSRSVWLELEPVR
jgi:hypothetical protein